MQKRALTFHQLTDARTHGHAACIKTRRTRSICISTLSSASKLRIPPAQSRASQRLCQLEHRNLVAASAYLRLIFTMWNGANTDQRRESSGTSFWRFWHPLLPRQKGFPSQTAIGGNTLPTLARSQDVVMRRTPLGFQKTHRSGPSCTTPQHANLASARSTGGT